MDSSGNNRYELLFMDDEGGAAPPIVPLEPAVGAGKKKTENPIAPKKNNNKTEKENKAGTLNKNNALAKAGAGAAGQTAKGKTANAEITGRAKNPPRGVAVDRNQNVSNGINKEQRIFRNNVRPPTGENSHHHHHHAGGAEYGNEAPQQRQFNNRERENRDRENRGPPRVRNADKFGKREFDRQSGSDKTGIKSIDKRDGAGAHNWGSAKQDIDDMNKAGGEAAPTTEKDDSATEKTGEPAINPEEDESKLMTLDEWKALREQRAKPNYNLRKAGEGVDNAEWKKMVVLSKKKELDSEDELEYDPSLYPQRVGRMQRIVDIQFNFNDGRRSGFRKGPRPPQRNGPGSYAAGGAGAGAGTAPGAGPGDGSGSGPGPRPRPEFAANNGFDRPPMAAKFGGEKRRAGPKPLKVDDEAQFPTLS